MTSEIITIIKITINEEVIQFNLRTKKRSTTRICSICKEPINKKDVYYFTGDTFFHGFIPNNGWCFRIHEHCFKQLESNPNEVLFKLKLGIFYGN